MPCISTVAPWQPWFIGRQANPAGVQGVEALQLDLSLLLGLEDVIAVFTNMWGQVERPTKSRRPVSERRRRQRLGRQNGGFPACAREARLQTHRSRPLSEPDRRFHRADHRLQEGGLRDDYRRRLATGLHDLLEPGRQQGFKPKIASIGKAILFPVAVQALGKQGNNLSSEVWWSPNHPFKSSLTGATRRACRRLRKASGKQWTSRSDSCTRCSKSPSTWRSDRATFPSNKADVQAIASTKLDTVVGPIDFGMALPAVRRRNVAKTPLVGGQWRLRDGDKYDIVITDNKMYPAIPAGGQMQPIA